MTIREFWRVSHRSEKRSFNSHFIGPYQGLNAVFSMLDAHSVDPLRPSPFDDEEPLGEFLCENGAEAVFGSVSRDALLWWFDGWWTRMAWNGFVVRQYRVPADCMAASIKTGQAVAMLPKRAVKAHNIFDFISGETK